MEKFKLLSRGEMRKITGGVSSCGTSCTTSGGCSAAKLGMGCGSNDGGVSGNPPTYAGMCQSCTCNGVVRYPCVVF